MTEFEILHGHLFCGLGAAAAGFNDARPDIGSARARFRCIGAIASAARHDNGRWSVADPRLPAARQNLVCVIRSLDGTWHRPFTTLEMACLQSLVDPEEKLELDGLSDQAWRERIGNAVPRTAATAIAGEIGRTLLLAWTGQTFALSSTPIWVRDVAVALSLPAVAQ